MSKKFLSPIKLAQGATNPTTGSSGELFFNTTELKVYAHNGTSWVPSGGGVTVSATAPSNPIDGDAWYNSTEGTLFIRFDGFWVESSSTVQNSEPNQIPAGAIMAWGSSTIPNNWLLCDGSAVSRTTYASLFAAIGTQYGSGDGSTTFNLPDLKGRTIVGQDSAQTEFNTLGETGGAKTHTLTASEIPAHSHPNTLTNATVASSSHTHGSSALTAAIWVGYWKTRTGTSWTATNSGGVTAPGASTTSTTSGASIEGSTDGPSATTTVGITNANNTGGGGAHNNLQPYIVLNYIIKYSAGETPGDSQLATRVGTLETSVRSVALGGTGAASHTSGAYLKGAGTGAITSQTGIPAGDITSGTLGSLRFPAGTVIGFNKVRTSARTTYAYNGSGDTIISDLNISITPKATTSMLVVQWFINYETDYNSVYRIYRDNSLITTSGYQGYNENDGNTWSGVATSGFDNDLASTPNNSFIQHFVPANSTSATTLQLAIRHSNSAGSSTFYQNRTMSSTGTTAYEVMVSNAVIWEIAQ